MNDVEDRAPVVVSEANPERLRLWVEALRSGNYSQTKQVLYDEGTDSYCCLGVACVVAKENGCEVQLPEVFDAYTDETLPWEVAEWFGIWDIDAGTDYAGNPELALMEKEDGTFEWRRAAALNDDENWTFEQIADAVEAKWNLADV